jgi:copper chaperone NosL
VKRALLGATTLLALAACAGEPPGPATLNTKTEMCRSCRMPVSDASLAAQIISPGEEPKFFDDIGCLRDFLRRSPLPARSVAYVADHRTRAWIRAGGALYTRAGIDTPMGSHWIAHADPASREADPVAQGGKNVTLLEIFGTAGPPEDRRP